MRSYLKQLFKSERGKFNSNYSKTSYSQCGEDIIVNYIFSLRGLINPTYIDVGANHPYYLNNTAVFYEKGCKGINIEANPRLINDFQKYRPLDINLNIGISNEEGELTFYIMEDNTLSTFSKEECDQLVKLGKKIRSVDQIKITTISNVLKYYFDDKFPDFMSLDVEGLDFIILQSIDFEKHYPKVICVESAEYSNIGAGTRRNGIIDFLVSKGYYEYANTNLNAIMVKSEFWFI
jgi:FkbM family methyltransferase